MAVVAGHLFGEDDSTLGDFGREEEEDEEERELGKDKGGGRGEDAKRKGGRES